ncbi:MAG TPA: chorismate-binding protein [Acidimicrobiia bacterium]|nr:chorismate-binding protein [Acidimicrobiia bacterium]
MSEPLRPSPTEFAELAQSYTVVPVWREVLADLETPVSVFLKLVGGGEGFLLESVEHGERWGRYSFVGRDPSLTLVARGGTVRWLEADVDRGSDHLPADGGLAAGLPEDRGALGALEALLARFRAPRLPDLPPFHGGIVGWLGYDIVREIERLPDVPAGDPGLPDAVMSLTGHVAAFDHFRQRIYLIENVLIRAGATEADIAAAYDAAAGRLDALVDDLARPLPYQPVAPPTDIAEGGELPVFTSSMAGGAYGRAVEVAREYILAGDIFQVVLAQRFDFDLGCDPFDVYRVLRQVNPSPYMYFLRGADSPGGSGVSPGMLTICGSSPEPMVQLLDGRVISRPIAGTRRRGRDDAADKRLAGELIEHPKERAEHVMLVDLARNDVGRVVRFGTERVDELMTLERYSHVMHLTSQVSGELRPGQGPVDVLRATFPAGTVSGAPKVRAMEIIDELEPVKRGPYAGVVGYVDFSGNLDTAIAIRTMIVDAAGGASVSAGAGIVADSDPAAEDLECHNKARAILASAAAARNLRARPQPTEAW